MNNFDYKTYLKNNYLLQEELEDNGPEEKAFDNEFDALGAQLATTHDNEKAFQAPIRRIVGLFTKDEKKKQQISEILYAIVILLMAGQAGGNAVGYLKKSSYLKAGLYSLKSLVKGKEVHDIFRNVLSDIVS
jgi:hypothetical protein